MSDDFLADLIPLPSAQRFMQNEREAELDELPIRRSDKPPGNVGHHRTTVDARGRKVICRDCDAELDPIEVLALLASHWERETLRCRHLRRDVDYLERELERLKRVEKNAKARIRTARKRADDNDALDAAIEAFVDAATFDGYPGIASVRSRESFGVWLRAAIAAYELARFERGSEASTRAS